MSLQARFSVDQVSFDADLSSPIDCTINVLPNHLNSDVDRKEKEKSVIAWNVPVPEQEPLKFDKYVLDTRQGGSCNANFLHFSPHTAGTHTECIGHITDERFTVSHANASKTMHPCFVLSIQPETLADSGETYAPGQPSDLVISRKVVQAAVESCLQAASGGNDANKHHILQSVFGQAVVIRTLPNEISKKSHDYSGSNPPYFTEGAMRYFRESLGVQRLVCDLPSVDRSDDQGMLLAHRAFWNLPADNKYPGDAASRASITEFAYIPNEAVQGLYLLSLQIAPIEQDAAPTRPLLFAINNIDISL